MVCLSSSADHSSLIAHPSNRVYSPYVMWRVACGVWRVRVAPPSVSVEDAADGRCALPCLFSLKHVQFSRARPHTYARREVRRVPGKVVSRVAPPQSESAGARADSPGTGYRYALPGFRRGANSRKTYIYIRGGGVGIHRFLAILGSATQVRIGTLDCKFDPGCKFDPNPNRDTACASLQVWSSVQVW